MRTPKKVSPPGKPAIPPDQDPAAEPAERPRPRRPYRAPRLRPCGQIQPRLLGSPPPSPDDFSF